MLYILSIFLRKSCKYHVQLKPFLSRFIHFGDKTLQESSYSTNQTTVLTGSSNDGNNNKSKSINSNSKYDTILEAQRFGKLQDSLKVICEGLDRIVNNQMKMIEGIFEQNKSMNELIQILITQKQNSKLYSHDLVCQKEEVCENDDLTDDELSMSAYLRNKNIFSKEENDDQIVIPISQRAMPQLESNQSISSKTLFSEINQEMTGIKDRNIKRVKLNSDKTISSESYNIKQSKFPKSSDSIPTYHKEMEIPQKWVSRYNILDSQQSQPWKLNSRNNMEIYQSTTSITRNDNNMLVQSEQQKRDSHLDSIKFPGLDIHSKKTNNETSHSSSEYHIDSYMTEPIDLRHY